MASLQSSMQYQVQSAPAARAADHALQVAGLCCAYPDRPNVLHSINLSILPGERVGIIGPNGAGKTTLFLSLCGVLSPTAGEIVLYGTPIQPSQFRPEIGLVFQDSTDQLFSLSVWDDVAFGPLNMGLEKDEVDRRVEAALQVTGITHLSHRAPHHLSGGEKRMVAIASVLAMQPQLIIYDEPSASLDIRGRRRLIQFLQQSQETILVSSHDLELIVEVCDRVILLDGGEVIADGKTRSLLQDTELMEAHGLETPHSLRYHHDDHH